MEHRGIRVLQNYFDKIFYINLDKRTDRNDECQSELSKYNIQAERVSAVDASTLHSSQFPPKKINFRTGAYGLLLTNLEIFKRAKTEGYKSIVIFEDDILFINRFDEYFEVIYQQVPDDWQMLYLGANHVIPPIMVTDNVGKCIKTFTTHAMVFKESVYDVVIEGISKLDGPIDIKYSEVFFKVNAYSFCPSIVFQRPSHSDIEDRFTNYDEYIR